MKTAAGLMGKMLKSALILLASCTILMGLPSCQSYKKVIEPTIIYDPPVAIIEKLPSAFPLLTPREYQQDWGKELRVAFEFTRELDFYRAITCYKRALFLIPKKLTDRRMQIEYDIMQCYYYGHKYQDVVETFEKGDICSVTPEFPAYRDLLILLSDSYEQIEEMAKACRMRALLEGIDEPTVDKLNLTNAVMAADLACIQQMDDPDANTFLWDYLTQAKSIQRAETLNAILPGAGYLYVGQKQTALTSFLINTLFIAAAYHFFAEGNIAAGVIISSLEYGWYVGGIHGAGLAAKEYNQRLYERTAKEYLVQQHLFPVLMLNYSF